MIRKIAIVGMGLMGGSLALALRRANPSLEIIGVDQPGILDVAKRIGAIASSCESASEAAAEADVIILATPLSVTNTLLSDIAPALRPGTVVHDLGSVKAEIGEIARQVLPDHTLFVGGHPMTGSEKSGIRHANELLFENATYVICPESNREEYQELYQAFTRLLESTGARVLELDASVHDRIAARVSHLPQLLSILLVNLASRSRSQDQNILDLAAGGFRDMTRIASSPYSIWRDILRSNRKEVLEAISQFERLMSELKSDLDSEAMDSIGSQFQNAEQTRDFIPTERKGFLHPLSDVYVFTSDRPGALVEMTSALYKANLSVKDIELLRIRENTGGTFRLGFDTSAEANTAVDILSTSGFSAYRL